eukprot:11085568-Alexandrium_andersonii.AAC.1
MYKVVYPCMCALSSAKDDSAKEASIFMVIRPSPSLGGNINGFGTDKVTTSCGAPTSKSKASGEWTSNRPCPKF